MEERVETHHSEDIPAEIKKWNWGAFFLSWIWGIGNQVWISLLMFVPIVNIVIPFVLGFKGSEWAWKAKEWESVEHFKRVQRLWAIWGAVIFFTGIILGVLGAILFITVLAGVGAGVTNPY